MFSQLKAVSSPMFKHWFGRKDRLDENEDLNCIVQKLQDKVNVEMGMNNLPVVLTNDTSFSQDETSECQSSTGGSTQNQPSTENFSADESYKIPPVSGKPVNSSNQRAAGSRPRAVHFDKPVKMQEWGDSPGFHDEPLQFVSKSNLIAPRDGEDEGRSSGKAKSFLSSWKNQLPGFNRQRRGLSSDTDNATSDSYRTRESDEEYHNDGNASGGHTLFQKSSREFFTSHIEESNFLQKLFKEQKSVKLKKSSPCREVKCCARNEFNAGCQGGKATGPSLPGDDYVWSGTYPLDPITALPLLQKTGSEFNFLKRESMEFIANREDNLPTTEQPCKSKLTRPCRDEDCCTSLSQLGAGIKWEKSDKDVAYKRDLKEINSPNEEITEDESGFQNPVVKFFRKKTREYGFSQSGEPSQKGGLLQDITPIKGVLRKSEESQPTSPMSGRGSPNEDSGRSRVSLGASSGASSQRGSSQTASGTTIASFMARDLDFPCDLNVSQKDQVETPESKVDATPMHLRDRSKLLDKTTFFTSTSVQCVSALMPEDGVCKYKKELQKKMEKPPKKYTKSCQERLEDEIESEWRHKKLIIGLLIVNMILMLCATVLVNYLIATYVEIYGILRNIHQIFNEWNAEYLPS